MALTTYNCTALTGGAARALDSYSVSSLVDGDRALCAVSGKRLYFMFDADSTDTENVSTHPYKVRPNDYATQGVWIEQEGYDAAAIHDNESGEISTLTEKTALDPDDLVIIEDSEASNAKKKVKIGAFINADYVKVSDVKAYNADGGTFTQDAWRTRDINTEDSDASGICSISSNQITLAAGTYLCCISCPASGVRYNQTRLYNITDSSVTILGTTEYSAFDTQSYGNVRSFVVGKFTIAAQKTFEVQHYCTYTKTDSGFGKGMDVSGIDTVLTVAEFWRVAT